MLQVANFGKRNEFRRRGTDTINQFANKINLITTYKKVKKNSYISDILSIVVNGKRST